MVNNPAMWTIQLQSLHKYLERCKIQTIFLLPTFWIRLKKIFSIFSFSLIKLGITLLSVVVRVHFLAGCIVLRFTFMEWDLD